MKLKTLAAAIALAATPFAAHSAASITGDIGVGYGTNSGGDAGFYEFGSEFNFGASHTTNGTKYYGHAELENDGDIDELRVGFENARFGHIRVGHLGDNGCATQVGGGDFTINKGGAAEGSCGGAVANGIRWNKGIGRLGVAVSYVPGSDASTAAPTTDMVYSTTAPTGGVLVVADSTVADGIAGVYNVTTPGAVTAAVDDQFSVGVSGKIGPVTAAIGHTTGIDTTGFSLIGAVGPVEVRFRGSKAKGSSAYHGINAQYKTAGGLHVYGGIGTSSGNDNMGIGVKKVIGKTDFFVEAQDDGTDTDYVIGTRHRF